MTSGPADVQAAVDELAASLTLPVLIEDARHQPLWWSAQGQVDGTRVRSILERTVEPAAAALVARMRLARADGPVRTPAVPEADMLPRWCVPMRANGELLGYLWVLDADGTVTDTQLTEAAACADQAAAWVTRTRAAGEQRDQWRALLLAQLQAGHDVTAARELIALERLDPAVTVEVHAPGAGSVGRSGDWDLVGGMTARLIPPPGEMNSARTPPAGTSVAASGPPLPLADLHVAVQRAAVTVRALRAGARPARPSWDALGSWHLVAAAPGDLRVSDIHPGADILGRLPRPELLTTARTVLECGGDIAAAAASLHIHRTTLYYRMERIEALTGVNLRAGPGRHDLHLALRLAAYRAAGG
jgi:PucR C-terminal helix-turn-helix domain